MDKKDYYIEQYKALRELNGGKKPLRSEFLKFCKIADRHLSQVYGKDPYSKLQQECGDLPNKLELERASIIDILNQYGNLVREKGEIPVSGDWLQANCSPQPDGLRKVHNLKWADMPSFFIQNNDGKIEVERCHQYFEKEY